MKKFLILIILLSIYSCYCEELDKCSSNLDCSETQYCNIHYNICEINVCLKKDIDCGKGECIPGPLGIDNSDYHCKCFEEAVRIKGKYCVPTCDGYSEECTEFGLRCNIPVGHCSTICQGEGSCKEGWYCDRGACELDHD